MKKFLVSSSLVAALAFSITACGNNEEKATAAAPSAVSEYTQIVNEAKAKHEFAKANGNVWKQKKMKLAYVDHYLAEAEKAKAKGDEAAALKFAKQALHSADGEEYQVKKYADLTPAWNK